MKCVRGTNVYPRAVESIVRECAAVDEFQIQLTREQVQDEITVRIELKAGREDHWPQLQRRLARDLASAHEGLRFNVEQAESNSLPRFELKAKRLVDKRPVAEYSA
jgi:phenylacetate-CoA ligase